MKIIYCIADIYNPGGMERVLLNKLRYWVRSGDHELLVVTTDQNGRPPFYAFPPEVRMVDLGIGYKEDKDKRPLAHLISYLRRRRLHRRKLTRLLMDEKAQIVVSLYPSESSFIPQILDGSKKVLELHFSRNFRIQYGRKGITGMVDRFRSKQDLKIVSRFDRFVVLTREDARYWGNLPNLQVIPNAAPEHPAVRRKAGNKRVIAVGRLDYQKGFDRLLDAWALLEPSLLESWHLDIFGQGEWESMLWDKIEELGIDTSVSIHHPSKDIFREYASSDFLVMTSHYEGFPMVMVEAMSCGVPVLSYDFQCGPRDIITPGKNGLLIKEGDIIGLAHAMKRMMLNEVMLESMSEHALEVSSVYSEASVMAQWESCFKQLLHE